MEKKTEAVNAYLLSVKKSKGEERKQKKERKKVTLTSSQKDWEDFYRCRK